MKILIVNDERNAGFISDFLLTKFGSGTIINTADNEETAKTELEDGLYDVAIIQKRFEAIREFVSESHIGTNIVWVDGVSSPIDDKELTNEIMKAIS
jgi:hypothetical protein